MIDLDSIPCPAIAIASRKVGEEAVVVAPTRGKVNVLNSVGARIWGLCDGMRNVRSIAAVIGQEFTVDREQAEQDTLAFLQDLETRGVIVDA